MKAQKNFTEGKILGPLLRFALPVLFALFLQSLYGAVDLMIVGKFAEPADVSGVSTGSQIMMTLTNLVSSLSMGMTVFLGQKIGENKAAEGGKIVANGIILFFIIGIVLTIFISACSGLLASIMNAPEEAYDMTVSYVRICGTGAIIIIAYNLIGSIFRGLGDSITPLVTVLIACIFNIIGDLALVAGFKMGTTGAALATVAAQFISVIISLVLISKRTLPFKLDKSCFKFNREIIKKIIFIGAPVALQDLLVGISFLVILAIVNSLGVIASAGVGVAEKVCGFIMLIPSAFAQSMSAFVSQNRGACKYDRAFKGLKYAIGVSLIFAVLMFFSAFFHGDMLSGIFANDADVIAASWDYLRAYAIDCLFTCFLFCFIGFFNGMEYTRFVMIQGIVGAFLVRIPVSYFMSKQDPVSLFHIGLATPCSTIIQITMCFICLMVLKKGLNKK
ncbi:MATE family efflux transporter [Butyrivibrio fibrisolvens]|uniref:Probable multidrug resistance protein NorM n=1 Tax=Butyrivibrio fibrisolvens TaxID=831 RepID=A0A317G3J6_BUTFI|nr:MATE family efflux transporter [Butyrivibrio fibrisolvens]PWT26990.1 MATE family efflux transporter [Butyrivibrio fibrisolvens]